MCQSITVFNTVNSVQCWNPSPVKELTSLELIMLWSEILNIHPAMLKYKSTFTKHWKFSWLTTTSQASQPSRLTSCWSSSRSASQQPQPPGIALFKGYKPVEATSCWSSQDQQLNNLSLLVLLYTKGTDHWGYQLLIITRSINCEAMDVGHTRSSSPSYYNPS